MPKMIKCFFGKWLSEYNNNLFLCINILQFDHFVRHLLCLKMIFDWKMFCLRVHKRIFGHVIALVLSQCIRMGSSYFTSKFSNVCFIQMTCVQHDATTIYSASAIDNEMEDYFLLSHDTKQFPK